MRSGLILVMRIVFLNKEKILWNESHVIFHYNRNFVGVMVMAVVSRSSNSPENHRWERPAVGYRWVTSTGGCTSGAPVGFFHDVMSDYLESHPWSCDTKSFRNVCIFRAENIQKLPRIVETSFVSISGALPRFCLVSWLSIRTEYSANWRRD